MVYTIIEKETGKELYATIDILNLQSNEIAIKELRIIEMENPYFNFETREFYEHTTT